MGTAYSINRLGDYLFDKTRRGILTLLFTRPGEAFYVNEIVDLLQSGSGAVQRELRMMTEAGVVLRERRGNQVYFRANEECPVFGELKSIVEKICLNSAEQPDRVAERFRVPAADLTAFCRRHHVSKLSLYGAVLGDEFGRETTIGVLAEFEPGHLPGFGIVGVEEELARLVGRPVELRTPGNRRLIAGPVRVIWRSQK